MSDFQVGILITLIFLLTCAASLLCALHLRQLRLARESVETAPLACRSACNCPSHKSGIRALEKILQVLSPEPAITESQLSELAAFSDEVIHVWMVKPTLTIAQAAQHVISIRMAITSDLRAHK